MNRSIALVLAGLALGTATSVAPSAPATAATLLPAAATVFDLEVGKGKLVRLARPATSVFIADPDVADLQVKSPSLVYIFGKSGGATTLYAVGDNDQVILNAEVHVTYDVARIEQAIHSLVPRGAVSVKAVDDAIVLTGTVYSAADGDDIRKIATRFVPEASQLVNKLKVDAANQVNLRVRVAEVSRDIIKQLGIDWANVFNNGTGFIFGLATAVSPLASTATAGVVSPFALPQTQIPGGFFTTTGGNGIAFKAPGIALDGKTQTNALFTNSFTKIGKGGLNNNALLSALDNHGLITVLAEPNLTALSGEPANFLAGGEFPVPVPSSGSNSVGIEWKKFGVSLSFVATIGADERVSLKVMPEVSQLSNAGAVIIDSIQVPALTTRRAETTVELASGQSFAIAGLLQNNVTQNINKFPWLGDVPVLGQLFRDESFQRNETELVILVTPYIVHPIATASRSASPTDGLVNPTDGQLFRTAPEFVPQPRGKGAQAAQSTRLVGPIGFELE